MIPWLFFFYREPPAGWHFWKSQHLLYGLSRDLVHTVMSASGWIILILMMPWSFFLPSSTGWNVSVSITLVCAKLMTFPPAFVVLCAEGKCFYANAKVRWWHQKIVSNSECCLAADNAAITAHTVNCTIRCCSHDCREQVWDFRSWQIPVIVFDL